MAEQVIIEFISDVSQLTPAVDQLEKMGKVEKSTADQFKATNTEVRKHVKTLEDLNSTVGKIGQSGVPLKKTLSDLNTQVKGLSKSFMKDFQQGAKEALHAAGVSAEEFENALENVTKESTSLKAQLREMVAQLAQMKVSGQDNTAQYKALAQQAGQLKDAIADANQEVKNFGSDTSTLDGVISLAGGIAGGFAAVQGAAALFGDESEELQKTLLRVNAAMAILQGLQQLQTVLQKESAAATLLQSVATKAQTAAQVAYNFIVGQSVGLLKAFKIALALTGVGAFVIIIYELVQALKSSNDVLEATNKFIKDQNDLLEENRKKIQDNGEIRVAAADAAGKAESELSRIREANLLREKANVLQSSETFKAQLKFFQSLPPFVMEMDKTTKAWNALNDQIKENNNALKEIDQSLALEAIRGEKALAEERKKADEDRKKAAEEAADKAKKAAEDAAKLAKERRAAAFEDFKAGIELQLLAVKDGSEEQLELRKSLLRAELQIALDNEKLTLNQRKLLIQSFFKDRIDAEKKFAVDREKIILENIASDIQAELQGLDVSNERKLELTETAINLAAEMELNVAVGNGAKIAEINAKRDKTIRDARIASIQAIADYEIQLATATNGPEQRRLQAVQDNEKETLKVRIDAINRLVQINSVGVQKRIEALNKEREQGLINQRDYNLSYAQLIDEQAKIFEDAEKKKTDLAKAESEKRTQQLIADIQLGAEVAAQVAGVLESLSQLRGAKENADLERRKQELADLREAGAITEKEAISRAKRIDAEERKIKQQQAKRDKELALFNAVISTAKGIAEAIPNPFLIALAAAIGAAQIAIIASRPLPKFGKGKKNRYEGLAEVGETGTELIQSGGRMYVADKRQVVWLGKEDKVFNPQETIQMLGGTQVNTEKVTATVPTNKGFKIDYDKFGKAVAKHVSTNVYVDGIKEQQIKQQQFTEWQTKRRSWG
jgi:hypothetical protein